MRLKASSWSCFRLIVTLAIRRNAKNAVNFLLRNFYLVPYPAQIWANIDLWFLRGVPPVAAALAMSAAHCFIRAINSFFGGYNSDEKRTAFFTFHSQKGEEFDQFLVI